MRLYNRFSINVVFEDKAKRDRLKERLETVVDDLECTNASFVSDGTEYYQLHLKCDSGTGSLVNSTSVRWDNNDDPNDTDIFVDFVTWIKNFPL